MVRLSPGCKIEQIPRHHARQILRRRCLKTYVCSDNSDITTLIRSFIVGLHHWSLPQFPAQSPVRNLRCHRVSSGSGYARDKSMQGRTGAYRFICRKRCWAAYLVGGVACYIDAKIKQVWRTGTGWRSTVNSQPPLFTVGNCAACWRFIRIW